MGVGDSDERTPLTQPKGAAGDEKPPAVSLVRGPITWTATLAKTYSWRLLAAVCCATHLLKGFAAGGGDSGLLGAPMEFLFKAHGVGAGRMQIYMGVALSPWSLKPVLGLLSDSCPMFGYKKMPYIVLTSVLGISGAIALGLQGTEMAIMLVVFCLGLAFLQVATVDLLVEAKQSAEVQSSADLGPDFFMFTWVGINVGMIMAVLLAGPIIQYYGPEMCFLVALPFMALILLPTALNWIGEQQLPEAERWGRCAMVFWQQPEMFLISLGMGVVIGVITIATFSAFLKDWLVFICIAASCTLVGSVVCFLRPAIAHPVLFWFLLTAIAPKVDGALFYFYTDGPEVYPAGPHFSPWLYTTGLGLSGFLGSLAGYLSGSELFKGWRYRGVILLALPLYSLARLAMLPVILRWNRTGHYQVPDPFMVFPFEFLMGMFFGWIWIPKQVMNAHMCTVGSESTMLAIMAGTFNLGGLVSRYLGCWILDYFEVCPDGTVGDAEKFDNLWKPYTIEALSRLIVLPLLFWLIPNKLQTEVLIADHPEDASYGSPARRLRSGEGTPPQTTV